MSELKDLGHIYLECSNCSKRLVDIWKVGETPDVEWKMQAICCYCNDRSFIKKVSGQFRLAGWGIESEDGMDVDVKTKISPYKYEGDIMVIPTVLPTKEGS